MNSLKIGVLYGSYRSSRKGIHVANFIMDQLHGMCQPVLIDAKIYELPILDKMYKEYAPGQAPSAMASLSGLLEACDGFVIVAGEYNHGLPPGLKNLLDHFQKEYQFKPAAIATYSAGSFGGVRAAVHVRAVLGELGMVTIPSMLPFPGIGKSFSESGKLQDPKMLDRFSRFAEELMWYAHALHTARVAGIPD